MRLNAYQIKDYTSGTFVVEPNNSEDQCTSITWDSREIAPQSLYVALPGERVNGHDFVSSCLLSGATAVLVSEDLEEDVVAQALECGAAIIKVADTYQAVTDLAAGWRANLEGRIIALTGSTGKTTTKNLVRDVLSASLSVVATRANQNNELGVPRTLLNADADTQAVVVEMGMRGLGQLESLCEFVTPDWGVVTNAGECHIELLGSRENIARAKAEVPVSLRDGDGHAFMNANDEYCEFMISEAALRERNVKISLFDGSYEAESRVRSAIESGRTDNRIWARDIEIDDLGRPRFTLCSLRPEVSDEIETVRVELELRGLHNVSNSCCAAAVALAAGMQLSEIATALAGALPEEGRQQVFEADAGYTVINDAYNANPDSMCAALSMLKAMRVEGNRIAVLGDMGELGSFAPALHERVGAAAAASDLDLLVCIGELSAYIAKGARDAGMSNDIIREVSSVEEALRELGSRVGQKDAILVKASHFMALTRVVEGLIR